MAAESESCDFSSLPELAWVKIMQFLGLQSRYRLSLTCRTNYKYFHHPSLWNRLTVELQGGKTNLVVTRTVMPPRFINIIEKFVHLLKKLTLIIRGHHITFDDDSREMMTKLSEVCRLDSLTIEAGKLINQFHVNGIATFASDMNIFLGFIKNARRLKHLEIRSWPMYPALSSQNDINIFSVITENKNLTANIESLSLFWRGNEHWHEREPLLPSSACMLTVLTSMNKLSRLALKSPMLSNEVLNLLASPKRNKLKLLQINIAYSRSNQDFQIPDLSCDAWTNLTKCSPDLRVECSIMTQVPDGDILTFLKPEMPMSSMTFLKHSRCTAEMISCIADRFQTTLTSFNCYAVTSNADHQLLDLVDKCSKLNSLAFHGTVNCSSVVAISTRASKWSNFEFLERSIETLEDDACDGDDEVIRRNQDGELFLVDLNKFHQTDDNRGEKIMQMIDVVSEAMGYKWHPI